MEQERLNHRISVPQGILASFCEVRGIKRLAVFGSALRSDFGPESDIDLLVEFEDGRTPGLLGIAGMGAGAKPYARAESGPAHSGGPEPLLSPAGDRRSPSPV